MVAPPKVGDTTKYVIGVEGEVRGVTDKTVTIGAWTFPRYLSPTVKHLSAAWDGPCNEDHCDADHCDEGDCPPCDCAPPAVPVTDFLIDAIRDTHDKYHEGPQRFCTEDLCRESPDGPD